MKTTHGIGIISVALAGLIIPTTTLADEVTIGSSKDNTLYEDGTGSLSNGAGKHFFVGNNLQPRKKRGVIAFDIEAAIPAGSTINSVQLILHMSRTISAAFPIDIYPLTSDWGEGTSQAGGQEGGGGQATVGDATWIHTFWNTDFWTMAGGDYDSNSSATTVVGGIDFYTWGSTPEMVADVQNWLDDSPSNFGWIIIGDEETVPTAKRFDTKENLTPENRPALVIDFTPPAGGEVCPDSQTILAGSQQAGGFGDVCASDDVRSVYQSTTFAAVFSPAPIQIQFDGNFPSAGAALTFNMEGHPTFGGGSAFLTVQLWNYTTGSYSSVPFINQPDGTDTLYSHTVDNSSGDYVDTNGDVRALVTCAKTQDGPVRLNIDELYWSD